MKKFSNKPIFKLLCRYTLLLALVLMAYFSSIFYSILLKLTIYPSSWILGIFYSSSVFKSILFVDSYSIELIPACVALSAYVLLLILNLTTQMPAKKRIHSILFSFLLLLSINIVRIVAFSILLINGYAYFEQLHQLFWYFFSIALVIGVWFITAYVFKIKNIPIYSDFKSLKLK